MYAFHNVPVNDLRADVAIFGPDDAAFEGIETWSLKPLQRPEDASKNPRLTKALTAALEKIGAVEAYAPNVAHANGRIVNGDALKDEIVLEKGVALHRKQTLPADGVLIGPRQAFMMSAAGCPLILASGGGQFIAAHAGRDSLINRGAVMGYPTRRHVSIVDAIIETFEQHEIPSRSIVMVMMFSIPTEAFEHSPTHPEYGAYNAQLAEFVDMHWPSGIVRKNGKTFINLESIFVSQALQAQVPFVCAQQPLSQYPSLAHTRDGMSVDRRNLILVKRH